LLNNNKTQIQGFIRLDSNVIALPKVIWKKWMENHEPLTLVSSDSYAKEGNMRFELRKRAKQCMEDLTFILENMDKVSKRPALEFRRIFSEEQTYRHTMRTIGEKWLESLLVGGPKLRSDWQLWELEVQLQLAGIPYNQKKFRTDTDYYLGKCEKLRKKRFALERVLGSELKEGFPEDQLGKYPHGPFAKSRHIAQKEAKEKNQVRMFIVCMNRDGDVVSTTDYGWIG